MATLNLWADDLEAASAWYTAVLGREPYYVVPGGYVEFRVGDHEHELGIIARSYSPHPQPDAPGGAVVNWHVGDVRSSFARLLELGATEYEGVVERGNGEGFVTAAVVDPFGNVLGIMENPHYVRMLTRADDVR
ncbi:VOC family protein [Cellulosimicrobium arenosum]|nr:VOC family protein [Cellulosimicrobium arenosum]